jgi:hypothetical protein
MPAAGPLSREKGSSGDRAFDEVFKKWGETYVTRH